MKKYHAKNRNSNKRGAPTEQERLQFSEAFEAYGIHTPIKKYSLRYDQELHGKIRRDPEDIDTKWPTDALVDCGILFGDSFENMEESPRIIKPKIVPKTEPEKVIITIYF